MKKLFLLLFCTFGWIFLFSNDQMIEDRFLSNPDFPFSGIKGYNWNSFVLSLQDTCFKKYYFGEGAITLVVDTVGKIIDCEFYYLTIKSKQDSASKLIFSLDSVIYNTIDESYSLKIERMIKEKIVLLTLKRNNKEHWLKWYRLSVPITIK